MGLNVSGAPGISLAADTKTSEYLWWSRRSFRPPTSVAAALLRAIPRSQPNALVWDGRAWTRFIFARALWRASFTPGGSCRSGRELNHWCNVGRDRRVYRWPDGQRHDAVG